MDIGAIERDIDELNGLSGDAKLIRSRQVLARVRGGEDECARDFSIPFDQVRRLCSLVPKIQAIVSRLESGKKRRDENAEAKRED